MEGSGSATIGRDLLTEGVFCPEILTTALTMRTNSYASVFWLHLLSLCAPHLMLIKTYNT